MAWDSTRPVAWARLSREWSIYAVVMIVVFAVFLRDTVTGGSILGLAASYPMYLGFGAILAKFGYQRKSFRDIRRSVSSPTSSHESTVGRRPARPAPTRRTSTGPSQHRPSHQRKRKRR